MIEQRSPLLIVKPDVSLMCCVLTVTAGLPLSASPWADLPQEKSNAVTDSAINREKTFVFIVSWLSMMRLISLRYDKIAINQDVKWIFLPNFAKNCSVTPRRGPLL